MFCRKCGFSLEDGDVFCAKCGAEVKNNTPEKEEPKESILDIYNNNDDSKFQPKPEENQENNNEINIPPKLEEKQENSNENSIEENNEKTDINTNNHVSNNFDIPQSNKNRFINNSNSKAKTKKPNIGLLIGGIAVGAVLLIVFLIFVISAISSVFNENSGGGLFGTTSSEKTVSMNETLTINDASGKMNIKVLSSPEITSDGKYIRLKLSIENKGNKELEVGVLAVQGIILDDSSKKEVLSIDAFFAPDKELSVAQIPTGSKKEGYLYFNHLDTSTYKYTTIDNTILNSIKYIEFVTLNDAKQNANGTISADYNHNYIELN